MNKFLRLSLLLSAIICLSCASEREQVMEISGEVVNTETASILLLKPNQDMRFDSIIEIPVSNGRFHYKSHLENPEAVTLLLGEAKENGGGRFMPLFLENTRIQLTVYPEEEFDKNTVEGGKLNAEYKRYEKQLDLAFNDRLQPVKDSIRALLDGGRYNSDEMKNVLSELREVRNQEEKVALYRKMEVLREKGLDKTPKAKQLSEQQEEVLKEMKEFQREYMEQNPNIVSYSFLLDDLIFEKGSVDVTEAKKHYKILSQANPNHPYNQLTFQLISAIEEIKVGKGFVDFSAPTLDGKITKLSEQIKGKVAVLDLWATWCGPCIAKSREMVPLYNEYKDKGFTVVGVAGEFKNTDRLVKFLQKEKWPWLNLVELDRENTIWQKYGVENSGGAIFLIDENGKILAKNPTAEEVRNELETRLN